MTLMHDGRPYRRSYMRKGKIVPASHSILGEYVSKKDQRKLHELIEFLENERNG